MPEFPEIEAYRRIATPLIGQRIDGIALRDQRLLRRGDDAAEVDGVLGGATIGDVRAIGKVLLFDLAAVDGDDRSFALTFGLRGWLSVDGRVANPSGKTRARTPKPQHVRLSMDIGGHTLELEDLLRLATFELDFDESRLGPHVGTLTKAEFRDIVGHSSAVLKSLLMDQKRIAGIGNLIADEIFYQGGIDPRRHADDLSTDEFDALWVGLRRARDRVLAKGGSHQGVMIQDGAREKGAHCPRCGVEVRRVQVGGRTTYFCPQHQR